MSKGPDSESFHQPITPGNDEHAVVSQTYTAETKSGPSGNPTPAQSGQGSNVLPPAVRAVAAILIVDFLIGLWLALHTSGAITAYLAPQLPAVGLGALAWGFLPDDVKNAFGVWLASRLANPLLIGMVLLFGAVGLGLSMFVSTVIIESVEAGTSTTLHVLRGTPTCTGAATAIKDAKELRLNRLTTPQREQFVISPLGTIVWSFTATHVSIRNPKVIPWIPTRLQFPDDFEQMVTIEVLPNDATLPKLSHNNIRFMLTENESPDIPVASAILHEGSARIQYTEPAPLGNDTFQRWQKSLANITPDQEFIRPMLQAWKQTTWIAACYPLRKEQEYSYAVSTISGDSLAKGKIRLTNVITQLDLSL